MCVSCFSAVSHSVMSEMQVIEQETPVGAKSSSRSKLDMFDEPGFTSGPPKCVRYLSEDTYFNFSLNQSTCVSQISRDSGNNPLCLMFQI